ncbi:Leucine rich repeat protein [Entamoeba marina]
MLIVAGFFKKSKDFVNIVLVNSKYRRLLEKYRFNPISNVKLFHNITEQFLYYRWDKMITNMKNYTICYKVSYSEYKSKQRDNVLFKTVEYTREDIKKYGTEIPNNVTQLEEKLYEHSNIETITIPSSVKYIGYNCFSGCVNLKQITLSNSIISIGYNCFDHCISLEELTIPQSVQTIGMNCFYCCFNLKTIVLPADLLYIGTSCFYGCESLIMFKLPPLLKDKQVEMFLPSAPLFS